MANHEPDVRGRTVVWSAGALDGPADGRRWRRALGNAGLLGGAGLAVSGLLIGVATWSVVTPVDAQAPPQLWVNPPRVDRGVPAAETTTLVVVPVNAPSETTATAVPTGPVTVDDHGGGQRPSSSRTASSGPGSGSDDHRGSGDNRGPVNQDGSDDHGGSSGSGRSGKG